MNQIASTQRLLIQPSRFNLTSYIKFISITLLVVYAIFSFIYIAKNNRNCALQTGNESSYNDSSLSLSEKDGVFNESMSTRNFKRSEIKLKDIFFAIAASSSLWDKRKEYIKVWWKPGETRGVVWLEENVTVSEEAGLPAIRISGDTMQFPFRNKIGKRSALRISRVVSETFRLGMEDVKWFVMGDDDTVFIVDNLLRVLSKYDHNQYYYIGSISESHLQNVHFSYAMAYGGGGFAISYPLAKKLETIQDECLMRYPYLYGSDDRIQACMAELGVPLTRENGFHQYDVYGSLLGLLSAHPVTPLVSLHHLDVVDPIFPRLDRVQSLQHLMQAAKYDSASLIQQSICYDKSRYWSISISWGFIVQIIRGSIPPRELEMPTRTFLNWYKKADFTAYAFNTRPVKIDDCQKPFVFYLSRTRYDDITEQVVGVYTQYKDPQPRCKWKTKSPQYINSIVVMKTPDSNRWQKAPRRDCCRLMESKRKAILFIWVKNCDEGEFSIY